MSVEERTVRTGLGVLAELAPAAPTYDEVAEHERARSTWVRPSSFSLAVVGLVLAVVLAISVFNSGTQLAYAMEPGLDLHYSIENATTLSGEVLALNEATINYVVSDAGSGRVEVNISYAPDVACEGCFAPETFTQVVAADGEIISIEGLSDRAEIPEFVIPTPIPHAGVSGGFPLFLGPPLPDYKVGVGDTWETNQNGVAGTHELTVETTLQGRQVVVIESSYTFTAPGLNGEQHISASSTVWMDVAEGVVVQADVTRIQPELDKKVETSFRLDR